MMLEEVQAPRNERSFTIASCDPRKAAPNLNDQNNAYKAPASSIPGQAMANRYAVNAGDNEEDEQKVDGCLNDEDVESSRGSAWPSETSRLTPHQSTYQNNANNMIPGQLVNIQPTVCPTPAAFTNVNAVENLRNDVKLAHQAHLPKQVHIQPAAQTKKAITNAKSKEEPMTEVKRVPYRINHHEEGDMFEDFSCSSDFEKVSPLNLVGAGLVADFNANETKASGACDTKKAIKGAG